MLGAETHLCKRESEEASAMSINNIIGIQRSPPKTQRTKGGQSLGQNSCLACIMSWLSVLAPDKCLQTSLVCQKPQNTPTGPGPDIIRKVVWAKWALGQQDDSEGLKMLTVQTWWPGLGKERTESFRLSPDFHMHNVTCAHATHTH